MQITLRADGRLMRNCLYLVLLFMITSCSSVYDKKSAVQEGSRFADVDLCDVLNRPSEFDGREVRVSAILIGVPEGSFAYDPGCVSDDRLVWFEIKSDSVAKQLEPYFGFETAEFREKGVNRVKGQFEGIFETRKTEGFGHLNSANHKLSITNAADLSSVESNVSYPWR